MAETINGYKLVCTCSACPEQYNVFDEWEQQVGYLRLRHGYFRADFPSAHGVTVYVTEDTKGDGCFYEDERLHFLTEAINAIDAHIKATSPNLVDPNKD